MSGLQGRGSLSSRVPGVNSRSRSVAGGGGGTRGIRFLACACVRDGHGLWRGFSSSRGVAARCGRGPPPWGRVDADLQVPPRARSAPARPRFCPAAGVGETDCGHSAGGGPRSWSCFAVETASCRRVCARSSLTGVPPGPRARKIRSSSGHPRSRLSLSHRSCHLPPGVLEPSASLCPHPAAASPVAATCSSAAV